MNETDKQETKEIEVEGQPAPPDTKSWFEYSWKLQQGVPERLEDAAKFLAVMISLSLTIISTALGQLKAIVVQPIFIFIGLMLWLAALFFAFMVLFPRKYRFHSMSMESIKRTHALIIRTKQVRLFIAVVLYFIPFVMLAVLYLLSL
ncbi:MAG: hypothetical protein PVH61_40105 [Candidatus Aminicenantes bacterium]|jgi:hypothetical protein